MITELRGTVQALSAQVEEVRTLLQDQQSAAPGRKAEPEKSNSGADFFYPSTTADKCSWKEGGRGGRGNKGLVESESSANKSTGRKQQTAKCVPINKEKQAHAKNPRQLEPVPGKRKVWGTPKVCLPSTVKNAITQLTSVTKGEIQIKRKYKLVN